MDKDIPNDTVDRDIPLGEKSVAKSKAKLKRGRPRIDTKLSVELDAARTERHRTIMREKYHQRKRETASNPPQVSEESESSEGSEPETIHTSSKDEELRARSRKYARKRNRNKEILGVPHNFVIGGGLLLAAYTLWGKLG